MSYILEHGVHFLETSQRTLCDMFGFEDMTPQKVVEEKRLTSDRDFHVSILFTGTIQGEYVLSMNKRTAAQILGLADSETAEEEIDEMRGDFSDAFSEALNIIVGEAIQNLGGDFKRLTFSSPKITFGTTIYPMIPTARGVLDSELGEIECHFHLNLMKLNLTTSYNDALENYRKAQLLAEQTKETIDRIMGNISNAIFTIDENLTVNPGASAATYEMLEFEPSEEPLNFGAILRNLTSDSTIVDSFVPWVKLIFSNPKLDWHKDVVPLCNCNEITTKNNKILNFAWLPISDSSQRIDRIMVIVEDITVKRALEQVAKEMELKQERNLDLMSALLNLEPEEVMNYVEETRDIISASRKLAKSVRLDKAHKETLHKHVKVVEGAATQYNFKALQHTAQSIENELTRIDDSEDEEQGFRRIETELDDLQGMLDSIERISSRITQRDQVDEDAKEGIKVPLEKISKIENEILRLNITPGQSSLTETLLPMVRNLKSADLFGNFGAIKSMLERQAARHSKKILLTYEQYMDVDVEVVRRLLEPIIEILRNAVEHGVETANDREVCNKNPIGLIQIQHELQNGLAAIFIKDDGCGLDADNIAQQALAKKIVTAEQADKMSNQEKLQLIFHPGFSTCGDDHLHVNRGVGLAMIKSQIEDLNGVIDLETTFGQGTTFKLTFPISA